MTFLLLCLLATTASAQTNTLNPPSNTSSLAFSPDGSLLASSGERDVHLWDTDSWTIKETFEGFPCRRIEFSSDGQFIICSGGIGLLGRDPTSGPGARILDLDSWEYIIWNRFPNAYLSPDTETAVIISPTTVYWLDSATYEETMHWLSRSDLSNPDSYFSSAWIHPDNDRLFIGTTNDNIDIWSREKEEIVANLWDSNPVEVSVISGSSDGRVVASTNGNYKLKAWDANTYKILAYMDKPVKSMAFSPDSRMLAVGLAEKGRIELLDTVTWDAVSVFDYPDFERHLFGIEAVAVSPDGRTLASVPYSGNTIDLWEYYTPDIPTSIEQTPWGKIKSTIGGRE